MGPVKKQAYEIVKDLFADYIETQDDLALARYGGACKVYEPIFGEFILERKDRVEILGSASLDECEEFIKRYLGVPGDGIEVNRFFRLAEEKGVFKAGSCGTDMHAALANLTTLETRCKENGSSYCVFVRK